MTCPRCGSLMCSIEGYCKMCDYIKSTPNLEDDYAEDRQGDTTTTNVKNDGHTVNIRIAE